MSSEAHRHFDLKENSLSSPLSKRHFKAKAIVTVDDSFNGTKGRIKIPSEIKNDLCKSSYFSAKWISADPCVLPKHFHLFLQLARELNPGLPGTSRDSVDSGSRIAVQIFLLAAI